MRTTTLDLASEAGQDWEILPEGGEWTGIRAPDGGWRAQGHHFDAATYRTKLRIPEEARGKAVRLLFEAINFGAKVILKTTGGTPINVAEHVGGWMPIKADLTPHVEPGGEYELLVEVLGRRKYQRDGKTIVADPAPWQDHLADGILRGVKLELTPLVYMDGLWTRSSVDDDVLQPELIIVNTSGDRISATLHAALSGADWEYPSIPELAVTLEPGESRPVQLPSVSWGLGPASYWWPNVPYRAGYKAVLHEIKLVLSVDGYGSHEIAQQFGFRQFKARGAHYFLNDVRCNLRGDNQQEANFGTDAYGVFPGFGPPRDGNPGWPEAVDNLLRLNHNVLRIHQVPATPYMLDVADELGLMIIDETPVRGSEGVADFVAGRRNMIRAARELSIRDRHHASIVLWSAANEIWEQRGIALALQAAMLSEDDTRPIIIDGVGDLGPEIINMEHYCGGLGILPEQGAPRRTDRPYGETESVWPADNSYRGFAWMSTATRIRRLKENADIRNYVFNNVWSNYVPGQRPEFQYLEKKIKNIRWEWVVEKGMEILPPLEDPWNNRLIKLMQQSFHPNLTCDVEFDEANKGSDSDGAWPSVVPELKAGQRIERRLAIFNDSFMGDLLTVKWETRFDGAPHASGRLTLVVPLGEYRIKPISFTAPDAPGQLTLTLETEKNGESVFKESLIRFRVA